MTKTPAPNISDNHNEKFDIWMDQLRLALNTVKSSTGFKLSHVNMVQGPYNKEEDFTNLQLQFISDSKVCVYSYTGKIKGRYLNPLDRERYYNEVVDQMKKEIERIDYEKK